MSSMRARYLFTRETAEALPLAINRWSCVMVSSSNVNGFTRRCGLAEAGPTRIKACGPVAKAAALLSMARRKKDRRFIGWALPPYFGITKPRRERSETEMAAWDRFKNRRHADHPSSALEPQSCLLDRRRPLHGVDEDASDLGTVIIVVSLVSGSEVEDLALSDGP